MDANLSAVGAEILRRPGKVDGLEGHLGRRARAKEGD